MRQRDQSRERRTWASAAWNRERIRSAAAQLQSAADGIVDAWRLHEVTGEVDFTSRMLQSMKDRIEAHHGAPIVWRGRVLTNHASGEETAIGADFAGIFRLRLPEVCIEKGFLAQAKILAPGRPSSRDWNRLVSQCDRMLSTSPDSFVFTYSRHEGVRIIPALTICGRCSGRRGLGELVSISVAQFFERHFECTIGDKLLNVATIMRESIMDIAAPRSTLIVEAFSD